MSDDHNNSHSGGIGGGVLRQFSGRREGHTKALAADIDGFTTIRAILG